MNQSREVENFLLRSRNAGRKFLQSPVSAGLTPVENIRLSHKFFLEWTSVKVNEACAGKLFSLSVTGVTATGIATVTLGTTDVAVLDLLSGEKSITVDIGGITYDLTHWLSGDHGTGEWGGFGIVRIMVFVIRERRKVLPHWELPEQYQYLYPTDLYGNKLDAPDFGNELIWISTNNISTNGSRSVVVGIVGDSPIAKAGIKLLSNPDVKHRFKVGITTLAGRVSFSSKDGGQKLMDLTGNNLGNLTHLFELDITEIWDNVKVY